MRTPPWADSLSPQTLKEQKESRAGKGKGTSGEVGAGWGAGGVAGGPGTGGDSGVTSLQGPLVVTEELHLITFTLAYTYCGLELELEVRAGGLGGIWGAWGGWGQPA